MGVGFGKAVNVVAIGHMGTNMIKSMLTWGCFIVGAILFLGPGLNSDGTPVPYAVSGISLMLIWAALSLYGSRDRGTHT